MRSGEGGKASCDNYDALLNTVYRAFSAGLCRRAPVLGRMCLMGLNRITCKYYSGTSVACPYDLTSCLSLEMFLIIILDSSLFANHRPNGLRAATSDVANALCGRRYVVFTHTLHAEQRAI